MSVAHHVGVITHRVVDGNNLMGSRPDGWWRDRAGAQARLVGLLARHAATSGEQVTLFFDGAPVALPADASGVTVHFAAHVRHGAHAADDHDTHSAHSADDAIVQWLGPRGDRAGMCVVSSDGGLGRRVAELGVAVEGAGTFRRRLEAPRRTQPGG